MRVDVAWDSLDRAAWEELFAQAGPTPLVQSWCYGEAKRAAEGWRPRRALISVDGAPAALAQVLEKRVGGIGRVARLNRGPLPLRPLAEAELAAVIQRLRAPWRAWKLGALFLAPEVPAAQAGLMRGLGLLPRRAPAWCSAWLDLRPEPDALRKGFDGKWRNMLVGAEKAGLVAEVSADGLPWLMARYRELMAQKDFTGTPPALIDAMAAHAHRADDLMVVRALSDGEAVGGILVVRHGAAATYLVGWNGEAGRKLKANNFLLWQAMLALRAQGCQWFDLGGIDPVLTPGIAAFKRGMKGAEYTLAGEFLGL